MSESDDPFLAISDDSVNEQAIQDINAFLNAPSSVVVKKKSNNQIPSASTSVTNNTTSNAKTVSLNAPSQQTSQKKDSINFESSVFELPSFDSHESSEDIRDEFNPLYPIKKVNDPKPVDNDDDFVSFFDNNKNESKSNTPNSRVKANKKKSSYQKPNLISNQDLMNAFFLPDDKEKDKSLNKDTKDDKINDKSQNNNTQETEIKKIDNKNNSNNKESKLNDKNKKPKKAIGKNNNEPKKQPLIDIFKNLDLDTTEVDVDNDNPKSNSTESKLTTPPQNSQYKSSSYSNQSHFYYISPKTPIESFEYSLLFYLDEASYELKDNFKEELQLLLEQNLDYQNNIQNFISSLKEELQIILDDGASSLGLGQNQIEYETGYISDFFQSLSTTLKSQTFLPPSNMNDNIEFALNSPLTVNSTSNFSYSEINADLIQSIKSSFIENSNAILEDLRNNLSELSNMLPDFKRSEESRLKNVYRQKVLMRNELEVQELQINIERSNVNQKIENLKLKMNLLISDETSAIPSYFDSSLPKSSDLSMFADLYENMGDVIENLKRFDVKKVTSPLTSFSNRIKSISDDLLLLNTHLFNKAKMVSRSFSLAGQHKSMPYMAQAPYYGNTDFQNFSKYNNSDYLFQATSTNEYNGDNFLRPSNNKIINGIRERLANIKKNREEQIAKVQELILEDQ